MLPADPPAPSSTVLLATDVSARCDRAFDRAAQLATQWSGRLIAVHALEEDGLLPEDALRDLPAWRRPADPTSLARTR